MKPSRADGLLLVAFVLSGVAALGYEILWTRLLALALGNENLGVLGVIVGFFGGMAIGAAALHRRAVTSRHPVRMFAVLELIAAGYALVSPYVLYGLADLVPSMLGPVAGDNDSGAALAISIVVAGAALLPGTFCMGATLPALVEARRRVYRREHGGIGLGRLYAANTLGATVGVLATVHVLLPRTGMAVGAVVLSALGLVAAALAMRWGRVHAAALAEPVGPEEIPEVDTSLDPDPDVVRERWLLLGVAAGTGLVGVGLEVIAVQVLAQVLENTIYTFADILAVYLIGTSIGAWAYTRWVGKAVSGRPATVAAAMLIALALSVVIAASAMASAPELLAASAPPGASYARHLWSEMWVALAVFAVPTVIMGALFTHVVGLLAPGGVGRAFAFNTLGSALAPLVFGVWAVQSLGYRDGLFSVVYAYLILFGAFTWFRRFKPLWQIGPIVAVVAATALAPKSMILVEPESQWAVLEQRETPTGLVIVSEHEGSGASGRALRRLQVGRHFRMGGAQAFGERRMGHIPLLLAEKPEQVLFLGVGTGATLGAVAAYDLERVDAVELVPAVLDMLEHFEPINLGVHTRDNVHMHAADARRFVAASDDDYDVIVADLFHPARDGAGGLYALEHFEQVRERLRPGGLFAQWIPLYQLDRSTLRTIVRTFVEVFDEAHSFLGIYNIQTPAIVLIGRVPDDGAGLHVDLETLQQKLQAPIFGELLLQDSRDLFGAYLLDREALVRFADDAPLNTDLFPRVLLEAPRSAYLDDPSQGRENLMALIDARVPVPEGLVVSDDPQRLAAFRDDVARFSAALDHYLVGEVARVVAADERTTVPPAAVDMYLAAYAAAPEFAPARGMLYQTAARDPDQAVRIYEAMLDRTPDEARIYQAYLPFLRRSGQKERFEELREQAQARFAPVSEPESEPEPEPEPEPGP